MDIERLLQQCRGLPEHEVLGCILSNRVDTGNSAGGLISVAQFPALIADLQRWRQESGAAGLGSAPGPAKT